MFIYLPFSSAIIMITIILITNISILSALRHQLNPLNHHLLNKETVKSGKQNQGQIYFHQKISSLQQFLDVTLLFQPFLDLLFEDVHSK